MFCGHLDYLERPSLGGRPNTKPGDYGIPKSHNRQFIIFYDGRGPRMNRILLKEHLVEGPVTYDFTIPLRARDYTL